LHGGEILLHNRACEFGANGNKGSNSIVLSRMLRKLAREFGFFLTRCQRISGSQPDAAKLSVNNCAIDLWSGPRQRAGPDTPQRVRVVTIHRLQAEEITGGIGSAAPATFGEGKVYARLHVARAIARPAAGGEPP